MLLLRCIWFLFCAAYLKQILCSCFFLFCFADGFISNDAEFLNVPCMNLMCVRALYVFAAPPPCLRLFIVVLLKATLLKFVCMCVRKYYYLFQIVLGLYVYVHVVYRARHFIKRFTIFHLVLFPILEIHAVTIFFSLIWLESQYVYRLCFSSSCHSSYSY